MTEPLTSTGYSVHDGRPVTGILFACNRLWWAMLLFFLIFAIPNGAAAMAAGFSGDPTSSTVTLSAPFTGSSPDVPTGWEWFFSDGAHANTRTQVTKSSPGIEGFPFSIAVMPDGSIVLTGGGETGTGVLDGASRSTESTMDIRIDPGTPITQDSLENLQSAVGDTLHSFARDRNTGAWYCYNPAQETSLVTEENGVLLTAPAGNAGFTLSAIGRSGAMRPAGEGEISADGRVLMIQRAGSAEWYRNSDTSITQGMDIDRRPDGRGTLLVTYDLSGNLTPSMVNHVLTFSGKNGPVLEYRNLRAWDSTGRRLSTAMALSRKTLAWEIDDSSAVYPVTIDPDFVLKQSEYSPGKATDYFGHSVSISGDYAVVGAYYNDTVRAGYSDAGAAYFYKTSDAGNTWVLKQAEYGPGKSADAFGYSVSVSGDYAIIGAYTNDTLRDCFNAGAVYFYKTSDAGNTWVLRQAEYGPGDWSDWFGSSVSISGDYAVVGAYHNVTLRNIPDEGAVYFYKTSDAGNTWVLKQVEYGSTAGGDEFGYSVSVSGDYAVIGEDKNSTLRLGYGSAGAAYFYKTSDAGNTWVLKQAEYSPGIANDLFGWSVSVSGDYAVIGALFNDTLRAGYADAGAAYFYKTTDAGNTWVLRQAEYSPGRTTDYFGNSVSLSGDYAVVGAYYNDTVRLGYSNAGAAYSYTTSDAGNTWVLEQAQYSPGILGDRFGWSVGVSGDYAVVGAYYNDTVRAGYGDAGAAYFYLLVTLPPVAGFTADVTTGTAPLSVQFTDSSTNTPSSWNWSFGDGTYSTVQNPVHTFSTAGTYTVALNATNAGGSNTLTRAGYITVSAPAPVAAFSGSPTSGAAPLSVTFTDSTTGSPTGWAWFFGDETYAGAWTRQSTTAGWVSRERHGSAALPDSSIVLMGGSPHNIHKNDTWRSTDKGVTWTLMNASSGWTERTSLTSGGLPDGSIVLMGGFDAGDNRNDTWRSMDKGATWARMTAQAGWPARADHTSVVMPDGSIVLMGGLGNTDFNDTWRSTDNGATWTLMNASSGWTARDSIISVALPDSTIVLLGGYIDGVNKNDTWRSTDYGATWVLANASSGWTARNWHTSVAMPDGSIVLMGGYDDNGNKNDTWRSTDAGSTWRLLSTAAGWPARNFPTTVVLPDGSIVLMGGDVEGITYNDTWRFVPTGSSLQNPSHTYNTDGTYSVTLQASNTGGYNALQRAGYITVSAASPQAPAPPPSGSDSSEGPVAAAPPVAPAPVSVVQPPAPVVAQPLLAPELSPEDLVTEDPGQVTESYPMGFEGMSFNADNQNTLSVDLAAAYDSGAEVTQFFDRVEIYQHSSPGVRIAFYGSNFTISDRKIFGKVDRAEFRTDPLTGNMTEGNVTGSVRADLIALTTQVAIDERISPNATAGGLAVFRWAAAVQNLDIRAVAFTLDITKAGYLQTGSANITITVPAPWVERNGGRDAIRIARIPVSTSDSELLATRYLGTDGAGALVFEAYSPRGTSLFGLLAVKAQETKATPAPTGAEPAPAPKTAVTTITGMVSWVVVMLENNLIVGIMVLVIVVVLILYFWRQKRQY